VSMIFNWFKEDWTRGHRGFDDKAAPLQSREQFFARYARLLADSPEQQQTILAQKAEIRHLEYDWSLNDVRK